MKISEHRKILIAKLESIIGNCTYNVCTSRPSNSTGFQVGRRYRYPVTLRNEKGEIASKDYLPTYVDDKIFSSAYYRFGGNELAIVEALDAIIRELENNYGLVVEKETSRHAKTSTGVLKFEPAACKVKLTKRGYVAKVNGLIKKL